MGLGERAAGAPEIITPAAPWDRIADDMPQLTKEDIQASRKAST